MSKLQRIFESTPEVPFNSSQKEFSLYWNNFLSSDLGKMYQAINWKELFRSYKLKESPKGRTANFSPQGKLALIFLKAYSGSSDCKLFEHLNGSIQYQMFCGLLPVHERLPDYKIMSRICTQLARKLDIRTCQQVLTNSWKPYLIHHNIVMEDATCYESYLRYPTTIKLLWESVVLMMGQMKLTCKYLRILTPRTIYLKQRDRDFAYSRKRRKSQKHRTILTRSLLHLLNKLFEEQDKIEDQYQMRFPEKYYKKRRVTQKMLSQQREVFFTGNTSIPDRIVSISKSYIRPIIRGKDRNKVEFGAKVNMIQVDGINFIDHLSFSVFNETTRLKEFIRYRRTLFGKITHISADTIYATNSNRKWCTEHKITTDFKRKGRAGNHEEHHKKIAGELNKERSTRMEGSFGTEKQHYSLNRIKAKTELNEVLWIFFGVHTANAVRIAKRLAQEKLHKAVA